MRKDLSPLPSGKQLATRALTLPPPGRSLSITGVPICNARELRNPQPWQLTTRATHFSVNEWARSRLVTVNGISTRSRVLARIALGVRTSMLSCLLAESDDCQLSSLTDPAGDSD